MAPIVPTAPGAFTTTPVDTANLSGGIVAFAATVASYSLLREQDICHVVTSSVEAAGRPKRSTSLTEDGVVVSIGLAWDQVGATVSVLGLSRYVSVGTSEEGVEAWGCTQTTTIFCKYPDVVKHMWSESC
ncbi:uncharacterized protein PHALS_12844 [Plasmopara halstedii]|uniref:Uncharacterized protein n=1 Tax=Plasmopara halstedii TaxID=4781 RepID=A0A0P1AMI7_PLAHL|nr:uncharacterized protein PHALS_12844 [Plasmopara halstedii]CEG42582.1 hypothetical protein PHALS_12844 [Plasmopara halstedii]|eukprot:XP_024578951.1 hypothetical protein PHALS_12844 [Plasmopara halstedii]